MPPKKSKSAPKRNVPRRNATAGGAAAGGAATGGSDGFTPAMLATLNEVVANAIAQAIPHLPGGGAANNSLAGGGVADNPLPGGGGATNNPSQGLTMYQLLERFQKQKPESFRGAQTPIEARNWISHLEKIFDVLECTENQKVRLAIFKLEGDAQTWWNTLKNAEGEGFIEAMAWRDFLEIFYEQYFPIADIDAYKREYQSIHQEKGETVTAFMERFVRVASVVGYLAGTAEEQANKFKWALNYDIRRQLVST